MKIVVLYCTFILFAADVLCNDSVISKFHQKTFKLKNIRIQLMHYNKSYFNHIEMNSFKYNRTTTALNFTFNLKVDIEDKLEVHVQDYKFLSNEYRAFPIQLQINLRKCFKENVLGLGAITDCGNITDFYFYKDITYHMCNFVPDETRFPPLIPNGKFRMDFRYLYLDHELAQVYLYYEIYTPMKYPKA